VTSRQALRAGKFSRVIAPLRRESPFSSADLNFAVPTYEYRCPDGHDFEHFVQRISVASGQLPCPSCGAIAERKISAGGGLVFKGSGFYITDYGKDGKKDQRDATAASSALASDVTKSDGSKSDASKSDASKSDGSKSDGSKSDGSKSDGPKSDGSKGDGSKGDGSKSAPGADAAPPKAVAKPAEAKAPPPSTGKSDS